MEQIKISVIIPVYNVAQYLSECLRSVIEQSLKEIEVICIDDGSNDNSWEILCQYRKEHQNIILKKQKNQGAGAARNLGLAIAKGEYIQFMDADDYYADEDALMNLYQAAVKSGALIVGGKCLQYKSNKLIEIKECNKAFDQEGFIFYRDFQESYLHCRYIFRMDMLKNHHIVYPLYKRYEDPPFLVKTMLTAEKFYAIPKNIYVYRVGNKIKKYSQDITIDTLTGIKNVLQLAKSNQLDKLLNYTVKELSQSYECKAAIFYYIYKECSEIINLIHQINNICNKEVISIDGAINNIENSIVYKEQMKEKCSDKEVIIYGIGTIGNKVCEILQEFYKTKIIGCAVTNKISKRYEQYPIKNIEEYLPISKDTLIIVAVREESQKDIEKYINSLTNRNNNILMVDSEKIDLIYLLRENREDDL